MERRADESDGDASAADRSRALIDALVRCYPRLRGLVYETLRRQGSPGGGTPTNSPTALTHELFERLVVQRNPVRSDEHLMALASTLVTHIVADDRKRRMRAKRGAGDRGGQLGEGVAAAGEPDRVVEDNDAIRDALSRFSVSHLRASEVAALRLLFDLTHEQVAEALNVSVATVERDWRFARAWLGDELSRQGYGPNGSE